MSDTKVTKYSSDLFKKINHYFHLTFRGASYPMSERNGSISSPLSYEQSFYSSLNLTWRALITSPSCSKGQAWALSSVLVARCTARYCPWGVAVTRRTAIIIKWVQSKGISCTLVTCLTNYIGLTLTLTGHLVTWLWCIDRPCYVAGTGHAPILVATLQVVSVGWTLITSSSLKLQGGWPNTGDIGIFLLLVRINYFLLFSMKANVIKLS